MDDDRAAPHPHGDPGIASAEQGLVLLDGPDGIAVTLTPQAAAQTGRNLIAAATLAEQQPRAHRDPE
jgi:hypothetical protein